MTARISSSQRIHLQSRAEREVMRYKDDHALFHKHVHDVTLDPTQVLKCIEMDQHRNTIDYSCRRTGKTFIKELYCLKHLATHPAETEGIVAPREKQALIGMRYHLDAIRRSEILKAYLGYNRGRASWSDTRYTFANGSGAEAFGIMANVDGESLTIASLDETDDMDKQRLVERFLPMLGATRRPGIDQPLKPQVRISGVYQGGDTISGLVETGNYHVLPATDVYLGMALGHVPEGWAMEQRAQNSDASWMRQFLCINTAATNWIYEKHIHKAKMVGQAAGLEIAEPLPGKRYKRRGLISFGYDHGGHGESARASRGCLVVTEQVGNFIVCLRVRYWPADADEKNIERDLLAEWEYFRPDYAMGDAYGIGLITSVNDALYRKGLVEVDRMTVGEGKSSQSTWTQWSFAPIRFMGMTKHAMASALRSVFHSGRAAMPDFDQDDPHCVDWRDLVRHLGNIKEEKTKSDYSSFKQVDEKIGDDGFDAFCAAVWALVTRGAEDVATVIGTRVQTREQMLGLPMRLAA